jgi:hypothetical protein
MDETIKKEINKTTDIISSLIHEYLYKKDYTKTLDIFQEELAEKIKQGKFYSPPITDYPTSESLISYFKSGEKDKFLSHWTRLIPNNLILTESTLYKLNFYIQIYFAIYPILNPRTNINEEKIQKNLKKNMEEFKSFLERNKPQSESSSEFLAYYALPYIPDPRNNFTYVNLFKPEWTACIIEQIEKCVEYYSPNKVCNLPLLYDISMGKKIININNNINNNLRGYIGKEGKKMKELIEENKDLKDKEENNKKIFLESQKNWCSLALDIINCSFDLVELCNKLSNNQNLANIDEISNKLIKYQNFLVNNLNDLNKNKISPEIKITPLNIKHVLSRESNINITSNTNINNNVSISMNSINNIHKNSSPDTTTKKISNLSVSKELKKNKINKIEMKDSIINMKKLNLILNSKHPIYNEKINHLFKEIREKIYSKDNTLRTLTLYQIFFYDILGALSNNSLFKQLLSNKNINLEVIKLVNSLANYNIGKNYLLSNNNIIEDIAKLMISENTDTPLRQNCLGSLQKFSLRNEPQNKLIELNVIHYLIDIFMFQGDILSDYSIEYGLALLMNLSLRKGGKEKFEAVGEKIINILIKYLKYDNIQILTCINGMLYSLIKMKKIRKLAVELGIIESLENLKKLKNEQINKQIKCIQDELNEYSENNIDDINNTNEKEDLFAEEDIHAKDNYDTIINEYPESRIYDDIYKEKHYKILEEYLIKPNSELEKEEKIKINNFMNENLNMTKVLLMTNSYRSNDSEENLNINNNKRIKTEENYDEDDINKKENNSGIIITDYNNVNNDFDNIFGKPDDGFAFKTNDKIRRTPPRLNFQSLDDIYGKSSGEHPFKTKDKIRRTPPRYNFQRNIFK